MERAKLATPSSVGGAPARERSHKDLARSNGHPPKKAGPANIKPGRPLNKKPLRQPKAERLICRYCGSDDLAPSFIKRRDRRCRKCFSKRYGSAAPAKKLRSAK
jgi:hypothetical protein